MFVISLEERRMSFTQDIFYDSSLTLYVHVQYKYEIIVKIVLVNNYALCFNSLT